MTEKEFFDLEPELLACVKRMKGRGKIQYVKIECSEVSGAYFVNFEVRGYIGDSGQTYDQGFFRHLNLADMFQLVRDMLEGDCWKYKSGTVETKKADWYGDSATGTPAVIGDRVDLFVSLQLEETETEEASLLQ